MAFDCKKPVLLASPREYLAITKDRMEKRFWQKVGGVADECWIWQGTRSSAGYGMAYWYGRKILAHRIAFRIAYGEIRGGLWVLHRCDTPSCVNPGHLYEGTIEDNRKDMVERGREFKKGRGVVNFKSLGMRA